MNFFSDSKLTTTTSTIYLRTLSFFSQKKHFPMGSVLRFVSLFLLQSSLPKVVFSLSVDGAKKGFINKFVDGFENSAWQKKWAKKKSMNEKVCKFIHFIGRFNECLNEYDTYFLHLLTHICRNKVKWVGIYVTLICDNDLDLTRKKIREMYYGWITY